MEVQRLRRRPYVVGGLGADAQRVIARWQLREGAFARRADLDPIRIVMVELERIAMRTRVVEGQQARVPVAASVSFISLK